MYQQHFNAHDIAAAKLLANINEKCATSLQQCSKAERAQGAAIIF